MKRLLAFCLAIPVSAVFVGCESSEAPKSPTSTPAASKDGPAPAAPVPVVPQKGNTTLSPGAPARAD